MTYLEKCIESHWTLCIHIENNYKHLQEYHELTFKMEVVLRGPTATKATGASRRDGGLEPECGDLGG